MLEKRREPIKRAARKPRVGEKVTKYKWDLCNRGHSAYNYLHNLPPERQAALFKFLEKKGIKFPSFKGAPRWHRTIIFDLFELSSLEMEQVSEKLYDGVPDIAIKRQEEARILKKTRKLLEALKEAKQKNII